MGHKSGLKKVGARGKQTPKDVAKAFEDGQKLDIADLCRAHAEESVGTLMEVQRSEDSTANARVQAANSILDRAGGKPGTIEMERGEGGLTIVVNQLYLDGKPETVEIREQLKEVDITEYDGPPTPDELDLHGDGGSIVVRSPIER